MRTATMKMYLSKQTTGIQMHALRWCISLVAYASAQHIPLFHPNHSTIVTLFEWPFDAVARECEEFLGPNGFGGVQVSPISENIVLPGRPWYERYGPVSYKICSRSGNESDFLSMTKRCNAAGVRIYVDVVLNHMAIYEPDLVGTAGSPVSENRSYPAVPYDHTDFHRPCIIDDTNDAHVVRNCDLYGLPDLDQSLETVRQRISEFLNRVIDLGVAGFRVGTCMNMWPNDLKMIYSRIKNVSVQHGFPPDTRPFIYQEVLDTGFDPIAKTEYTFIGAVYELMYAQNLGKAFLDKGSLKNFDDFGPSNGYVHSADAIVYLDTHDLQRVNSTELRTVSFKNPGTIETAYVYMLAHDFGLPRILSSYYFDEDHDAGPPMRNGSEQICSPFEEDCSSSWVLEHRWPIIVRMIQFRNAVGNATVREFRSYAPDQVAFCRGRLGFAAFNNSPRLSFNQFCRVCLPPGYYCDVTSFVDGNCSNVVFVSKQNIAHIEIPVDKPIPAVVLYVGFQSYDNDASDEDV